MPLLCGRLYLVSYTQIAQTFYGGDVNLTLSYRAVMACLARVSVPKMSVLTYTGFCFIVVLVRKCGHAD